MAHYHSTDKQKLLELKYPDSMYDERLFLMQDGRKRGLWIFLEDDAVQHIETDVKWFDKSLKAFMKEMKIDEKDRSKVWSALKLHFDWAFGHRHESRAVRMSWRKSRKLAAAINKEIRREKHKSLEDYDDAYGKDADEED